MIIDELIQAQKGSQEAADKIIKHYQYFIYYLMKEYHIILLNFVQKFHIHN